MDIKSYVGTLKGVTAKEDIMNAIDTVIQDLNSKVSPLVTTTAAVFKTIKIKSPDLVAFEGQYISNMEISRGAKIFSDLEDRLKKLTVNLQTIRGEIEKSVAETVSSSSIEYRTAVLMQLTDHASFLLRYIRRFAEYAVIYETQQTGIYENYAKENISRGEEAWIKNRFPFFMSTLLSLSDEPKSFSKKFEDIPNIKVDGSSGSDASLFGRGRTDPFRMGFIPLCINPFFIVGRWIVEYQAWRYKEAEQDLVRIQKRIMLLEEATAGKGNPHLEKELEILRDKAEGLTYRINKAEEEL